MTQALNPGETVQNIDVPQGVFDGAGNLVRVRNPRSLGNDLMGYDLGYLTTAQLLAKYPASTKFTGYTARLTDLGNAFVMCNGVRWGPVNGSALIKFTASAVSNITTTELFPLQALFPGGLLVVGDAISLRTIASKSGTTSATTVNYRVGVAGTTADDVISTQAFMSAGQQTTGGEVVLKVTAADAITRVGPNAGGQYSYNAPVSTAPLAAVTLASGATIANDLYFSCGLVQNNATDSTSLVHGEIYWRAL
jgi:hypothetical protein